MVLPGQFLREKVEIRLAEEISGRIASVPAKILVHEGETPQPVLAEDPLRESLDQRVVEGLRFPIGLEALLGFRQLQPQPVPVPLDGMMQAPHHGGQVEVGLRQAVLGARPQGPVFEVLVPFLQDQENRTSVGQVLELVDDLLVAVVNHHKDRVESVKLGVRPTGCLEAVDGDRFTDARIFQQIERLRLPVTILDDQYFLANWHGCCGRISSRKIDFRLFRTACPRQADIANILEFLTRAKHGSRQ